MSIKQIWEPKYHFINKSNFMFNDSSDSSQLLQLKIITSIVLFYYCSSLNQKSMNISDAFSLSFRLVSIFKREREEGRNIRKERKKGGRKECFCSCMHNLSTEHESVSLWGLFHSICPTFFCAGGRSCAGEGATEVQTPSMTRTTKRMKTKAEVDIAIFWESSIETRTQTCKMF